MHDSKGHYPQIFFPLGVLGSATEYRRRASFQLHFHAISNAFVVSFTELSDRETNSELPGLDD